MTEPEKAVRTFLESWKPYAELAPGNPARRTINRFIATEDATERREMFAKVNMLYRLHEVHEQLGIRREDKTGKTSQFRTLIEMPVREMEAAIAGEGRRGFLEILQGGFEFGRSEIEPRVQAGRAFILDLWNMPVEGLGMKFSIYPNGVLFSAQGLTHDEMAKRFNTLGLGSGRPLGGGELQRQQSMAFVYDTASTAFGGVLDPNFVAESLRRWVRLTGGQDEKVELRYETKLGVPNV